MTVNEAFSKNLAKFMKEQGFIDRTLAESSGLMRETIMNIRLGNHGLRLVTAHLISTALNKTLDEMVEGADE